MGNNNEQKLIYRTELKEKQNRILFTTMVNDLLQS